jgi:hypothetical protein
VQQSATANLLVSTGYQVESLLDPASEVGRAGIDLGPSEKSRANWRVLMLAVSLGWRGRSECNSAQHRLSPDPGDGTEQRKGHKSGACCQLSQTGVESGGDLAHVLADQADGCGNDPEDQCGADRWEAE